MSNRTCFYRALRWLAHFLGAGLIGIPVAFFGVAQETRGGFWQKLCVCMFLCLINTLILGCIVAPRIAGSAMIVFAFVFCISAMFVKDGTTPEKRD